MDMEASIDRATRSFVRCRGWQMTVELHYAALLMDDLGMNQSDEWLEVLSADTWSSGVLALFLEKVSCLRHAK